MYLKRIAKIVKLDWSGFCKSARRLVYIHNCKKKIYSTQTVGAYNTKTTCRKHADSISMYSIMYVCMDVFIVFADDHRITLDEI